MGAYGKSTRFALASYSYGGNPNLRAKRIAVIPDQVDVKVGDQVFVNVVDCKPVIRQSGWVRSSKQ